MGRTDYAAFMPRPSRPSRAKHSLPWMISTQPGLSKFVRGALRDQGAKVLEDGNDGRADVVFFEARDPEDLDLSTAEDLFVVVGKSKGKGSARKVAARLFDERNWQAGFAAAKSHGSRVGAVTGFRVIARVLSEREFKRTDLRSEVTEAVQRWRPRWRVKDPADVELWVLEVRRHVFVAAIRISSSDMRSRGGRAVELEGSLRPVVAAAMVRVAAGSGGLLFDPFCGSGTILGEGGRVGWLVKGSDIDPSAVKAAQANFPGVEVTVGDAADLPLADGEAAAIVTNAPFGVQHVPRTGGRSRREWWRLVLAEFRRVVRPGGSIVILHPDEPAFAEALRSESSLQLRRKIPIRTLGQPAVIWSLLRSSSAPTPLSRP